MNFKFRSLVQGTNFVHKNKKPVILNKWFIFLLNDTYNEFITCRRYIYTSNKNFEKLTPV